LLDQSGFKSSEYLFAPCLHARRVKSLTGKRVGVNWEMGWFKLGNGLVLTGKWVGFNWELGWFELGKGLV
jgi:hypothetical protein